MAVQTTNYPVTYSLAEPDSLSRWLWLFKWLLLIPHFVVLYIVGIVTSFVMLISWVVILVTGKHPRGLWDFMMGLNRWSIRVNAYAMHLTDTYPPFTMDEVDDSPVQITATYVEGRSRLTTFFRWLLAIPHFIIIWLLSYLLMLVVLVHVIIVIFTGKPNKDLFKLMVGILRWQARASCYVLLITDEYPPFSMD